MAKAELKETDEKEGMLVCGNCAHFKENDGQNLLWTQGACCNKESEWYDFDADTFNIGCDDYEEPWPQQIEAT